MQKIARHSSASSNLQRASFDACVKLLHQHYRKQITVTSLAKQLKINEDKLKKGFKEFSGETIHNFLIKIRMDQAKWILVSSEEPIKNIPHLVGYHQRNFFHRFQTMFGCTPLQWRLKNCRLLPNSQ